MKTNLEEIETELATKQLLVLGSWTNSEGTLLLIGPNEPAFWHVFTQSPEYQDGQPHPMDRWSTRTLTIIAETHNIQAFFPFGSAPYHPFYTWAVNSGRFWPSPIGFLVHDNAGLFASFRGALLIPDHLAPSESEQPCDTCERPCTTACPVGAFDDGYNVDACKTHLATPAGADCMSQGCRARRACPIGQGNRLPDQAAFHMNAFL